MAKKDETHREKMLTDGAILLYLVFWSMGISVTLLLQRRVDI